MSIAIIDYGSGNLRSAAKSIERAAANVGFGNKIIVTSEPDIIGRADRIVLPGVGAFSDCRNGLYLVDGMIEALTHAVKTNFRPFLGICVGMQLMATWGCEHKRVQGLGWISGEVNEIKPKEPLLKIPHMGWNTVDALREHPILEGIETGPSGQHAYFVHSYNFNVEHENHLLATFDYGGTFTAIVGSDNLIGTQFHPEKSQRFGLRLIENFLNWSP